MIVPASGTGEQRANCLNCLPVASDNSPDIALPHLQAEDGGLAVRDFRQHHFVRKLDEMANDELEKLFHALSLAGLFVLSLPPARCFSSRKGF